MILHSKISGEGKDIIILHGLFGMLDNWNSIARVLNDNYRVHLVDQRNHGRSFHSEHFTYPEMAEDLIAYMDHHDVKSATVIGHSMGGKVAMHAATAFPERIEKLVVVDIAPRYYPVHHREILNALLSIDLEEMETRGDVEQAMLRKIPVPAIAQFLLKNLYWVEDGVLGWRFNLKVLNEKIENVGEALDDQATYKGPALFIKGGNSDYITPNDGPLIHLHFPNSEVKEIENAGHWIHAEAPKAFLKMVQGFMVD